MRIMQVQDGFYSIWYKDFVDVSDHSLRYLFASATPFDPIGWGGLPAFG
jgi:hypothetical protein